LLGADRAKLQSYIEAAWQIGESAKQAISIDNVLDALEDPRIELVGKLGIARAIIKAEADSPSFKPLSPVRPLDLSRFDETWYSSFTKLLTENVRKSAVDGLFSNLEIINFNYDRCIEHYLPFSLANYYGVEPDDIRKIMETLVVHRPYGATGRLPWQKGNGPPVKFGTVDTRQLIEVAKQLQTFTERVQEGTEISAMKSSVAKADRIIFLGFAFHRQNVELIAEKTQGHTEIIATALNISSNDRTVIKAELESEFGFTAFAGESRITFADTTCQSLFKDYWRSLTAKKSDRKPMKLLSYKKGAWTS